MFDKKKLKRAERYGNISVGRTVVEIDFNDSSSSEEYLRAVALVCSASTTRLVKYRLSLPTLGYMYLVIRLTFAKS